jgi:type I restriction enzyme, S subunit
LTTKQEWKKIPISKIATVITGFPFKSRDFYSNDDDIRLLRGDNVVQGSIRWNNAKRWSKHNIESFSEYLLSENDIVLAMDRPWISAGLKYARINKNDLPCLLVQRVSCLKAKENTNQKFLKYVIGSNSFTEYVLSVQTGSTIPHISKKQIEEFEFLVPDLKTQEKITKILSDLDTKIENLQNQNKILEQTAQAIFQSWFVNFDGVTEFEDSELEKIPKGWSVEILENIKDQKKNAIATGPFGSNLKTSEYVFEGIPVIRGKDFEFGLVKQDNFVYITKEKANSLIPSNVFSKDILITSQGSVGNIGFVPEISKYSRYVISSNLMKISINSKIMPPVYVFYYLKSIKGQQELLGNTSTTGVPHIAQPSKVLRNTRIIIPNDEILQNFNMITTLILQIISKNKNEISSLTSIRDVLLPKLMSGEIRV